MKKQRESGFTLIELIVVIVILGILAATALPRFIDLRADAAQAAVNGVAGALNSAAAINYGARQPGLSASSNAVAVTNCVQVSNALLGGLPDTNYAISTEAGAALTLGGTRACTVRFTSGGTTYSAAFTAIGAP